MNGARRLFCLTGFVCSTALVQWAASAQTVVPSSPLDLRVEGGISLPPDPVTDNGLGNFWIDTNGGSCARQGTAGTYVDAQACSSMSAAYAAASCGDVVRIKAGSYGNQSILENAAASTCGGNPIVFRAEVGQRPTFQHIRLGNFVGNCTNDGPDNITLRGLAVTWGIDIEHDSTAIVVDDFTGGSFGIGGLCSAPDNVIIRNSEWGPCHSGGGAGVDCRQQYTDGPQEGKNKISDGASNILIENNVIHDFLITDSAHFECIWVGGGNNVTIRRNHFYNCVTNAIAMPDTETQGTWIIENNWFGNPGGANAAMKFGLNGGPPTGNVYIRFNSFGPSSSVGNEEGGGASGRIHIIGNILGENYGCISGAVYAYNLVLGQAGCHSTDKQISSLPYLNTSGLGAANYHLLATPTPADGYVPSSVPNSGVATDWDGDARGASRDAGADEH